MCIRKLLLDARVDIMISDKWWKTALDIAMERGHHKIANMLKRMLRTPLLRIPNAKDIVRMIIEEYV